MSDVKRYDHRGDPCGFEEDVLGNWVGAADYDALLAERDALRKDAERYRWLLRQAWFQQAFDRFDPDDGGLQAKFESIACETIDRLMADDPLLFAAIVAKEA